MTDFTYTCSKSCTNWWMRRYPRCLKKLLLPFILKLKKSLIVSSQLHRQHLLSLLPIHFFLVQYSNNQKIHCQMSYTNILTQYIYWSKYIAVTKNKPTPAGQINQFLETLVTNLSFLGKVGECVYVRSVGLPQSSKYQLNISPSISENYPGTACCLQIREFLSLTGG